jgi:carboxyl-terminal processing protease
MMPASNRGAGMSVGFPDVCLTPAVPSPVPTPYPNLAMNAQATPFSETVFVSMMNALNTATIIPSTSGDEAGSASPIKGPGRYTMGCPNVYVDMMPAINLLSPTTGNNMNNPIGAVLVPSTQNVLFNHRAAERTAGAAAVGLIAHLDEAASARRPVTAGVLRDESIGYAAVEVFAISASALLYREVKRLQELGMTALLLDLRGCPGGDLDAAVLLAGDFLERGSAIAAVIDGDGDETLHRARGRDPYAFPLLLLVDRLTASAAELFAGALQVHRRALVVGERTYGKGTVQRLLPGLAEPGAHYATVATFTLPDGAAVEGRGILPDVEVAPEDALDAALTLIASAPPAPNEVP